MRIIDLLKAECIALNQAPTTKVEAIDTLIDLQMKSNRIKNREIYKNEILKREALSSTAVGDGIAIPHAKSETVSDASLCAITVPNGVNYDSPDGEPTKLLFMIAAPKGNDVHLEVLAKLMTMLMDEKFILNLLSAKTPAEFLTIIDEKEKDKDKEITENPNNAQYKVLAVTACPTGIAHTYMAQEALEKAGKRLGISIKVETNGSGGAKNILTEQEIENCDGIIVAADKAVEMSRFDGKKVITTSVSDGIKIPEKLINQILSGNANVYNSSTKPTAYNKDESLGRTFYKHLMTGVSNMLPFTVAGGIFIALAFLIDSVLGAPQNANFGSYTKTAAFFKTMGGYAFNFMIPILSAYIGKSISDRPGFLVGLVGGLLATTGSSFQELSGNVPSGFLGALLAGFLGGYIMLGIERLSDRLPKALNGIKPVLIYPLTGLLSISIIMCAVNPIMGIINTALSSFLNNMGSSSKVVLGIILGAMMSIDMGGPFNKAAYVFGTASIASGNYDIMAAVMVGGMVPPLAIALATTFFKSKWTKDELKNGPVNYIMGLSFITEGAIPYAASDPLRVIPSCMIGSAVAGGLSMAFRCTLMAPHGGIFVFAVVGNWPMYFLSLIVGSLVGMLLLWLLKKENSEEI